MRIKINGWRVALAAIMVLIGFAYVLPAKPGTSHTVKLADGEEVFDLNGEWDAVIENYGLAFGTQRGSYKNVIKITQEGSLFRAIRLEDDSRAPNKPKGSMFMQGELDKNGFKKVYYVDRAARLLPCTGEINENGDRINIDEGFIMRATLKRK
jgi:hypothetical protein